MLINLLYCPGHAPPRLTKNFLVPNVNSGEIETPLRAVLLEATLVLQTWVCRGGFACSPGSECKVQASALLSCLLG